MSQSTIALPAFIFLGFCAKRFLPVAGLPWTAQWAPRVDEIASVCAEFAERPPNWDDLGTHNRAACWNDEVAAWALVPRGDAPRYRLYAYYGLPAVFGPFGVPHPLTREAFYAGRRAGDLPPAPDRAGYARLGYDVIQYTGDVAYGCSPLSCNGMAARYPVNRACLLDDLAVAVEAATAFGIGGVEPGPYIIIEVWRRQVDGPPRRDAA